MTQPRRVHIAVRHRRRWVWSPSTWGPTSRPGGLVQVSMKKNIYTAEDMVPCQSCYCTLSTFKLLNSAVVMPPPLLKCQKSILLNRLWVSDYASAQENLLFKSIGDQNVAQPKASGDQLDHQQKGATSYVAQHLMGAIVLMKSHWPILSDGQYSIADEALIIAIEVHDCQWALAGAPVGTSSVCPLPGGPSLKIDLKTQQAIRLRFCY